MGFVECDLAIVVIENARNCAKMAGDVVEYGFRLLRPAGVVAHDQEETLRQRPHAKTARHVAGERPRPFMRRIAVQVDMQLGLAQFLRREADCLLVQMRAGVFQRPVFEIVAERRVAGGVMHVARVIDPQALVQRVAIRVLDRRDGEMGAGTLLERTGSADRADNAGRLVRMLAAADHDRRVAASDVSRRENAAGARPGIEFLSTDVRQQSRHLRNGRWFAGRIDFLFGAIPKTCAQRPGFDTHADLTVAAHDLRHDLAGLQATVAERTAGLLLEEFQQREIEVLVQRLAKADDFVANRQRHVFRRMGNGDVEFFEIGFFVAPVVVCDRVDCEAEQALVIRLQALAGRAIAADPAGRGKIGFPDRIGMHAVRCLNLQRFRLAVASERDVIDQFVIFPRDERDISVSDKCRKRIGLEPETVGRGVRMNRITHLDRCDAFTVDLFQKREQKRLVGAVDPRRDAFVLQRLFGGTTAFRIVECPGFDRLTGRCALHQSVERTLQFGFKDRSHDA